MMKKNLLEIIQQILSDMDSEDVNSLSDSVEALQIAKIVEQTFYDMIAARKFPEHESLIKLTSASSSTTPTHFSFPDNVKEITDLWYDVSSDNSFEYRKLRWCEPRAFLTATDSRGSDYDSVSDLSAGTNLRIFNDRLPTFYTSFDDQNIIMDSYDSSIESNLQESKVRSFGITYPVFSISDTYTPDIDATMFPMLIQEAKSRSFSVLKGGVDQKIEQAARRMKVHSQNDRYKNRKQAQRYGYGRVPR